MLSYELNEILESIFQEGVILSFLNGIDKGLIIVDKNESIIFVNKKAQVYLKKKPENIRGKKINEIISFNKIQSVLIEGLCFCDVKAVFKQETNFINISPIEINRDIMGAVVVFEDANDHENYINTLKLCNSISRELESVFNSSYDEIIVTDPNGNILKMNEVYKKFYNLEEDSFIGKNVFELQNMGVFSPSVTTKVIKEKKRISITQKTNSGKVLIVTGHPIFDGNENLIFVISMAKDITEIYELREKLSEARKTAQKYYYQLELLKQKEDKKGGILHKSLKMKKVMCISQKVAHVDSNVLISGESGVGKSMLAHEIHKMSDRCQSKFMSINCGAIPETLLESELFGYEKGAFTGARKEGKIGKLDLAHKGTLFLDEISELPMQMQVKILKAIQEKKFTRVGGTETLTSDFRLITATNKNLNNMVKEGRFREDLFYRLNVIPIEIPPLRERKRDIIILIHHFWEKLNRKYGINRKIDQDVYNYLTDYHWPGNVRELENCIERIMVTVDKDIIHVCDLPVSLGESKMHQVECKEIIPLKRAIEETEKEIILKAYKKYNNTYKVAEVLGVSQSTIVRKLKKYGCSDVK
ncbi:sigma 54-interacting transcriptional regulator [Marinisporobacter balticus]|uniref:HTH-type transcriptional regulatory protein TyrR n=1 Tax=Marinisporobacter balticus TaxID=2018667 RepID=A0A4V6NPI0_9FIRM|nr:sigma 54-interacting transcriptional regulator [Marinisporobacter balticus]TCO79520.1 PAS domain S-box-containing protein/TyrR family helix-turn-helix protein [Marinisporobacter balticus]